MAEPIRRHPTDREILLALATMSRDQGDIEAAIGWASRLRDLVPGDPGAGRLLAELQQLQEMGRAACRERV